MNRIIKFRAWDRNNQRFINLDNYNYFITEDGNVVSIGYDNDGCGHFDQYTKDHPNIELSQFTGLKDRQGKEIYEGDIVKDILGIGSIIYFKKYASFMIEYYNKDGMIHNLNIDFEVIGNIYENPELLK